jgi:hypothetical protein
VLPYDDAERLERVERQVRYLLRHFGIDPEVAAADESAMGAAMLGSAMPVPAPMPGSAAMPGPALQQPGMQGPGIQATGGPVPRWPEIVALVQNNRLVEAIKLYREVTGASLKDSKDAIDTVRTDIRPSRRR